MPFLILILIHLFIHAATYPTNTSRALSLCPALGYSTVWCWPLWSAHYTWGMRPKHVFNQLLVNLVLFLYTNQSLLDLVYSA